MIERIKWHIKQLFPLTYHTTYKKKGIKHFTIWKMWFGRCYDITDFEI